jgi:hypothetical protein
MVTIVNKIILRIRFYLSDFWIFFNCLKYILINIFRRKKVDVLMLIHNDPLIEWKYSLIKESLESDFCVLMIKQRELEDFPYFARIRYKRLKNLFIAINVRASFKPKIILLFDESYYLNYWLKLFSGSKTLLIAHAVTSNYSFYHRIYAHYYLVYGVSSIVNLLNGKDNKTCKASIVFLGPIFCEISNYLPIHSDEIKGLTNNFNNYNKILLITSSFTFDKTVQSSLEEKYVDIVNLIIHHPEILFLIKLHPLEKPEYFWSRFLVTSNHLLIENECTIKELSNYAIFNITCFSNSAIDCALFGLKTILFKPSQEQINYIDPENYLPVAHSKAQLMEFVDDNVDVDLNRFLSQHSAFRDLRSLDRLLNFCHTIHKTGRIENVEMQLDYDNKKNVD